MVIQIDSREKPKAITKILNTFQSEGVEVIRSKLPYGDYMSLDNARLVVDRKQNLLEVASNFGMDEKRFTNEMKNASKVGIKIVFLVEHGQNIKEIEDVALWVNPRLKESPLALSGLRIYRKMLAYQNTYGVEFRFCTKAETGKKIIEILGG